MKTEQNKTNKNTEPESQLLSVEIRDVESGEILKEGITRGISCVFVTENITQTVSFFTGINTVEGVEIVLCLQKLANEIEKNLKERTSEETFERIKKLIKESNPDFSGNMESKEGE